MKTSSEIGVCVLKLTDRPKILDTNCVHITSLRKRQSVQGSPCHCPLTEARSGTSPGRGRSERELQGESSIDLV